MASCSLYISSKSKTWAYPDKSAPAFGVVGLGPQSPWHLGRPQPRPPRQRIGHRHGHLHLQDHSWLIVLSAKIFDDDSWADVIRKVKNKTQLSRQKDHATIYTAVPGLQVLKRLQIYQVRNNDDILKLISLEYKAAQTWAESLMVWLDYDTNDNLSTICWQIVYNLS